MKNLTWQNPEQLFVAQVLINKVKSKCCGIKVKYEFVKNGINHEPIKFMITNIHVSSLSAIKMNHIQKITSAINDSFHMSMHDLGIGITIDDKVGDKIRIAILIFTIALN